MIIYQNSKENFMRDADSGIIANKITELFKDHHFGTTHGEFLSWRNSLMFMRSVLADDEIARDAQVAIEYQIPLTAKRVDFLIAGADEKGEENIVVVELKQWTDSEMTDKRDIVRARLGGEMRAVTHPCYQAYSYAKIIGFFNEDIYKNNINLYPCAYLHNYEERRRSHIDNDFYRETVQLAPIFLAEDTLKLRSFIRKYIRKKADTDLLMKIEFGKIKPAKALQDAIGSMIKGNQEFQLIDEQKVAYETVKDLVDKSFRNSNRDKLHSRKYTIVIKGGPGTGKSVIAISLLCDLIQSGKSALYITKTSAPRNVFFERLKGEKFKQGYIKSLFRGSGTFVGAPLNSFDCLIVDEAHRLTMKSGMFQNIGESQIKEIIHASCISVFFIDEDQKVTTADVGSIDMIREYARQEGSTVIEGDDLNLVSQFRCGGSDGYLAFLDNLLEIRETANYDFDIDYDIRIYSDPNKMREELRIKNQINNKSRMLAGYCYNWVSKKDHSVYDINLKDGFKAQWNFDGTGTWAIDKESFEQVGCIHTSQGLEFDYCGVIIGKDLVYRDGHVKTDYLQRAKTDQSLKGIKKNKNYELADRIIRNTYRTLMSRGQKGCFVYCEDEELAKYMADMLKIKIID